MNVGNVLLERIDQIRQTTSAAEKRVAGADTAVEAHENAVPTAQQIQNAVEQMNRASSQLNERISFSYNEKVNRVVVKVINQDTNEVVREIPPRDIIKLTEHIQQYLGMIVDESR